MRMRLAIAALLVFGFSANLAAQSDSVDVTFFYKPTKTVTRVFVPGEFNGWGPNTGGVIAAGAPSEMSFDAASGRWYKTVRLRVGGQIGGGVAGAYQYKLNENGTSSGWLPDPLNPRQNASDNNNSVLFVKSPTIHYLLPNSLSGVVKAQLPLITAYIFPSKLAAIDTASISITLDGTVYTQLGEVYDPATNLLSFLPAQPLANGTHKLKLTVRNLSGSLAADSTTFVTQGDPLQILTRDADTQKAIWRIRGQVYRTDGALDSTLTSGILHRNTDAWGVRLIDGKLDTTVALVEGDNLFQLQAAPGGVSQLSETVQIHRRVDHNPFAIISFDTSGSQLTLSAAPSTDPDPGQTEQLVFSWQEDPGNPESLGVAGQQGTTVAAQKPTAPGEYYFTVTASDPDGHTDTVRQFLDVRDDGVIVPGTLQSNPVWVRDARLYIVFFKGLTAVGTIAAALPYLDTIKALGFNLIWVLPVMDNAFPIDNGIGPGYNIVDFYKVAPEYGTNQDFKDFIARAHSLGLKVILDFTPNHSSRFHPFAEDARKYGVDSQYWPYYQHNNIPHNTNGLGLAVDAYGFYYYGGFGDQLLNWDWSDLDARAYMLDVLDYWLQEFDLDGYRLDVYWGPHRRYGESNFDRPLRRALKHTKPDILLLGEDDGTGVGTEFIYADQNGGVDAAYDFKLFFNQIRPFGFNNSAVNGLHTELVNGDYYPGANAYYFRFMETQDEDRIAYVYNSFEKTMPMASVLFTASGLPGIMQGQEVGYGKGISGSKEDRVRKVVDFNFSGRSLLFPHYQKIVNIRAQFPAFRQHKQDTNGDGAVTSADVSDFVRVATTDGLVYAFARPYLDHNGLTVVNFSNVSKTVTVNLTANGVLDFSGGIQSNTMYFLNDLYSDTHTQIAGANLNAVEIMLPAYGTAIFVISQESEALEIPTAVAELPNSAIPRQLALHPNYPNPFNPETTLEFDLPASARVQIKIFDLLGREIATLLDRQMVSGPHRVVWNARAAGGQLSPSGIYLVRLQVGTAVAVRKITLMK